ncbi:MAG: glycosyltransferase, partial [Actinobacteria bacterium]|nr:glycosyltransferase [Actinomycetota bacterium]
VLAISHFDKENRIFEDYCTGIKENSRNYYFIDYIELYSEIGGKDFEEHVEHFVIEKKVDLIFLIPWSADLTLDVCFIERLSRISFTVMNFYDSTSYFEQVDRYYAQAVDLVLLPDPLTKTKYELLNINALCTFSLFDKRYYRHLENNCKDIDVSFVGNIAKSDRRYYLDYLLANGVKINTFGRHTGSGFIDFNEMIEVFNKSKINLNFTGISDSDDLILGSRVNNRARICNGRPIEIALCRGFVLSEYVAGIEEMFEIGKEIDVFRSKNELWDKVAYYLKNERQRKDMTEKAYERAVKDYDTVSGFSKVFNVIKRHTKTEPVIYLDKDFIRNYTSYRFFYITKFTLSGKFFNLFQEFKIILKNRRLDFYQCYQYTLKAISVRLLDYPKLRAIIKNIFNVKVRY